MAADYPRAGESAAEVAWPQANASRAQVRAFREARAEEWNQGAKLLRSNRAAIAAQRRKAKRQAGKVPCAACGKFCDPSPLAKSSRIRFSAKFKGRVFEAGATLCHRHSAEAT